jgi:hypothetical protein
MNLPKMIPINNSDTAWLIVADYNQDNGIFHEELREDVYNPNLNDWNFEFITSKNVGTEDDLEEALGVEGVGDGNTTQAPTNGGHVGGYINQWINGGFVGSQLFSDL